MRLYNITHTKCLQANFPSPKQNLLIFRNIDK